MEWDQNIKSRSESDFVLGTKYLLTQKIRFDVEIKGILYLFLYMEIISYYI